MTTENVGGNIAFSVHKPNLAPPENHTQPTQVPRRTLDPRDQPPKESHPVGRPLPDLILGDPRLDFSTLHFDFSHESNFSAFQGQRVPHRVPQGNPQENPRESLPDLPQGTPYGSMDWNSGSLAGFAHGSSGLFPHGVYPHDDGARDAQARKSGRSLDSDRPWNEASAGLT